MSGTPGPSTRARASASRGNTPAPAPATVPALAVGQSFGYGAPGKATLRTQVASETTSLTSVMQNTRARTAKAPSRAQSVNEEEDEDDRQSVTSQTPSRRGPGRPRTGKRHQSAQPAIIEEKEPVVDDAGEEQNGRPKQAAAPKTSSRAPSQQSRGIMPPNTAAPQRLDGAEIDRSATVVDPGAGYVLGGARPEAKFEPTALEVTLNTIPKWLKRIAWLLLAAVSTVVLLYYVVCFVPLPRSIAPYGERFFAGINRWHGVSPYNLPPADLEELWIDFRSNHTISKRFTDLRQQTVNLYHEDRLDRLENRVTALEIKAGIHDETLTMLEDLVPSLVAVEKKDNQWVIPEPFWRALHERLDAADDANAPLWQAFLRNNEEQIRVFGRASARSEIDDAVGERHIISQKMFQEAIGENYATLENHFTELLRRSEATMLAKLREEADRTTHAVIERSAIFRLSRMQANALAYANLIKNTQEAMENINYFSPGLGARVNPHGTSLTYKKPGRKFFDVLYTDPHPPIKALQRYEEAGDCWCAAPSTEKGRAQIEIIMGQTIFPDRLVIEHMPRKGTLQINAAPKELEVWLEVESPAKAQELTKYLEEDVAFWERGACGDAPTPKHLCIGKGNYDIHHDNWVQSFSMFAEMTACGIAGNKVIVRATGNWGADYTCLYRLRMTGERVVVTN